MRKFMFMLFIMFLFLSVQVFSEYQTFVSVEILKLEPDSTITSYFYTLNGHFEFDTKLFLDSLMFVTGSLVGYDFIEQSIHTGQYIGIGLKVPVVKKLELNVKPLYGVELIQFKDVSTFFDLMFQLKYEVSEKVDLVFGSGLIKRDYYFSEKPSKITFPIFFGVQF